MSGADNTGGGGRPINFSYNANNSISKQNSIESSETISPAIESSSQPIHSMTTKMSLIPTQQQIDEYKIRSPQTIKGVVHSNLPLLPNGENPNVPQIQNVKPLVVVQSVAKEEISSLVTPKIQLKKARIIIAGYLILWVSAIIVLTVYAVLLTKISPPLDLFAARNWWSYFVLFLSCSITILVTTLVLCWSCSTKGQLGYRVVMAMSAALAVAFVVVVLAWMGASRTSQKKIGLTQITWFGLYVLSVCGNGTEDGRLDIRGLRDIPKDKINNAYIKDKCDAVAVLRTSIYFMYIWVGELFIITGVTFFLGKCGIQTTPRREQPKPAQKRV